MNKDVKQLLSQLEAQGFTWEKTRNGRILVRTPEGRRAATLPSQPNDHRGLKNAESFLRKAGFKKP